VTSKGAGGLEGGWSPGSQSHETQYELLGGNEIWEAKCGHDLLWLIHLLQLADLPCLMGHRSQITEGLVLRSFSCTKCIIEELLKKILELMLHQSC
jgi:hypothetical protein